MDQGNINDYLKPRERAEANRIELVRYHTFISALADFFQLVDVAKGLSYMHSLHVVHGNLKGVRHLLLPG